MIKSNYHSRVLFAFLLSAISGCSYPLHYLIQNRTRETIIAVLKFKKPVRDILNNENRLSMKYVNSIITPNNRTIDLVDKPVEYEVKDFSLKFEINPSTTVLVGLEVHAPLYIDSVFLIRDTEVNRYSFKKFIRLAERKSNLMTHYFTYVIE